MITSKHIHRGSVLQSEQLNATTWLLQASAAATAVLQSAAIIQDILQACTCTQRADNLTFMTDLILLFLLSFATNSY